MFRGRSLLVDVNHEHARYSLLSGDPLSITHHGEALQVNGGKPADRKIPPLKPRPSPSQPPGRTPLRRQHAPR
jgi:alpha,alpha-trehalose phosphorylase